jgi:Sel1 repeat
MRQALIVTVLLALMAFIADRVVNWTSVNAVSVSMPNVTLPAMTAASARNEGGSVGTLTGARASLPVYSGTGAVAEWLVKSLADLDWAGSLDAINSGWRLAVAEALKPGTRGTGFATGTGHATTVGAFAGTTITGSTGGGMLGDQDYGAAVARYALAVNPNDADAHYSLGLIYRDGKGVEPDYAAAARHFLAAAEGGNADAQFAVADLYALGRGVPRDAAAAYRWYALAALGLRGDADRAAAAAKRDGLAAAMTPEELAAARRLVAEWQPREAGSPSGQG